MSSLGACFRPTVIRDLAGPRVFARGVGYFEDGRVEPEGGGGRRMRATVRGSLPYGVELWVDDGEPAWSCACPAAEDGSFRKGNDSYRSAVDLMGRIRRLAAAAGEPERFDSLLSRVRTEHTAKRNLRALLDARRW